MENRKLIRFVKIVLYLCVILSIFDQAYSIEERIIYAGIFIILDYLLLFLYLKEKIGILNKEIIRLKCQVTSLDQTIDLLQTEKTIHNEEIKDLYRMVLKDVDDGK